MKINSVTIREILAIGALIVILLVGINFWTNRTVVISAPLDNAITHSLPDDSKVLLSNGASMKYSKGTWEEERMILLLGEATFTVQNGAQFQVKTATGMTEALEGQFTIRAWGNELSIECYEGKVTVYSRQQEAILTPNQSVKVVNGQMENVQRIVN